MVDRTDRAESSLAWICVITVISVIRKPHVVQSDANRCKAIGPK